MAYTALAIANALIELDEERGGTGITPMQLQKLLYYSHAWSLALRDEPLIVESFQKWDYGPVVPSVYYEFRQYGAQPILEPGTRPSSNDPSRSVAPTVKGSDEWTWNLLERVLDQYGRLSGVELSIMSHRPSSAWARTEGSNAKIPDSLIKEEIAAEIQGAI
ncbi:Panacea domain-containing protein [Schauerella aestuarii]|uniref:Panacea domain-containing protein n=1 Tax=Schauerella aestuarii TaxID=2511204 RepID=UPI0013685813|nr:type II toxin-antitoxin system antitoxin SocA domain-containing protein [Achromobacter aestuarii]MYZ44181.1 DUF4065 domain-containing protein [Achromobacter aestuarii]